MHLGLSKHLVARHHMPTVAHVMGQREVSGLDNLVVLDEVDRRVAAAQYTETEASVEYMENSQNPLWIATERVLCSARFLAKLHAADSLHK